jgi:cellulose synthase/poly-beta-1,6-N-acetylglucosamine synthase-like glycosyltransferase
VARRTTDEPAEDSFYRSGYFRSALLIFLSVAVAGCCLASGPVSAAVAVLLLVPVLDGSIFLCMRLKAPAAARGARPPRPWEGRASWPAISVVMPSYEEPFDVKKMTLDSVLGMGYPGPLEVIAVDNSRDTSSEDFVRWREHLEKLGMLFVHNPRADALKPGNVDLALRYVTGEFVLFVDVDSSMPGDPGCLAEALEHFDADPGLGHVQFHVIPTNGHFNALTRGVARYHHLLNALDLVGGMGGFTMFKGHNALWRKAALDAIGSWREELGGRVVLAEDFLKAFDAYAHGYRGRISWTATGEWIPNSLATFTSMWHRWIYGTMQVAVKQRLAALWRTPGLTGYEKTECMRRVKWGTFFMPYLAVAAALFFPSAVFVPYLVLVSAIWAAGLTCAARLDAHFGRRPRGAEAWQTHAVMALIEPYVGWIGFVATLRFLRDALRTPSTKAGWAVTTKAVERRPGFLDLLRKNGPVHVVHTVLVGAALWLLPRSSGPAETFVRLFALLFFLSILLLPLCLGRVSRAGDNDAGSATVDRLSEVSDV